MEKKSFVIGILLVIVVIEAMFLILILTNVINLSSKQNTINVNDDSIQNQKIDNNDNVVGTYKYTYSFIQNDVSEDSECKTITLDETLVLNANATFTYVRGANCSNGESAKGTFSVKNNKIYLYNEDCIEEANCRKEIVLPFTEKNGVITINDNDSTSGWHSNSTWGATKLPETILQKVN